MLCGTCGGAPSYALNLERFSRSSGSGVWSHIDKSFSRPVIPNENEANYIPKQIISELFKSEGYDGIFYKSMFGEGNNLVLFNVDADKCLAQKLYEINKIDIDYQKLPYPL